MQQIIGVTTVSFFSISVAWAITRYRFFNIHFILKRWLIQAVFVLIAIVIAVVVAYILSKFIGYSIHTFIILLILLMSLEQLLIVSIWQKYWHMEEIDFSLPDDWKLHKNTHESLLLLQKIIFKYMQSYGIDSAILCVLDYKEKCYHPIEQAGDFSIPLHHALVTANKMRPRVLYSKEIDHIESIVPMRLEIKHFLSKHKVCMVIPLYTDMGIYGFVLVKTMDELLQHTVMQKVIHDLTLYGKKIGVPLEQVLVYENLVNF